MQFIENCNLTALTLSLHQDTIDPTVWITWGHAHFSVSTPGLGEIHSAFFLYEVAAADSGFTYKQA